MEWDYSILDRSGYLIARVNKELFHMIVGIPFGKQFFKMARLSFMPFGASVIG